MKKLLLTSLVASACVLTNAQTSQTIWSMTNQFGANAGGTIVKMNPDGTGFTKVYDFNLPTGDLPYGNILQASDGNLYATTEDGGPSGSCVIFRYNPNTGVYTDVHDFWGPDGYVPLSGLTEYNAKLYGVTIDGGVYGYGVIYSYDLASGVYTDLYDFNDTIGGTPTAALTLLNGKLLGTCQAGGANNGGIIFSFDPSNGNLSVLHNTTAATDGGMPYGKLTYVNGLMYGTMYNAGSLGFGTVYSINPSSLAFAVLHTFDLTNGAHPSAAVTDGGNGNIYGVTEVCGSTSTSTGTMFKINIATSAFTMIHTFGSVGTDGTDPVGDLFLSPDGKLYGITSTGGSSGDGITYSLDPSTDSYAMIHTLNANEGGGSVSGFCLVTTPASVNDPYANENSISLFPSPAHDVMQLSTSLKENTSFCILNSLGQSVMNWNEEANSDFRKQINVADLENGIYFVEMKNSDGVVTKKFVKE